MDASNPELVRKRFARHLATYGKNAPVQTAMAAALPLRLCRCAGTRSFPRILEIGCGTGKLTRLAEQEFSCDRLLAVDLVPECETFLRGMPKVEFLAADAERDPLPGDFDLVISNAALQWFKEQEKLPERLASLLKPGGWCAVTTFGPENLREVRAASGFGLNYLPCGELSRRFSEFFELRECREEISTEQFDSPQEVLRYLKRSGVTASGGDARWSREKLAAFEQCYQERFSVDGGKVTLTWHPVTLIARKKER